MTMSQTFRKCVVSGGLAIGCLVGAGVAGGAWMAAATTVNDAVQTATVQDDPDRLNRPVTIFHKVKREAVLERIAAYLGVSKEEVEKVAQAHKNGWRLVVQAAPIAKLSGKPLADVVAYKASGATWKDTEKHFGVELEDVQNARKQWMEAQRQEAKDAVVSRLAEYLGVSKAEIEQVIQSQEGRWHLVVKAAPIAKLSGKPLADVVAYLANGATMEEAAEHFGVELNAIKEEREKGMSGIKK